MVFGAADEASRVGRASNCRKGVSDHRRSRLATLLSGARFALELALAFSFEGIEASVGLPLKHQVSRLCKGSQLAFVGRIGL